jgi:hypothetical protein
LAQAFTKAAQRSQCKALSTEEHAMKQQLKIIDGDGHILRTVKASPIIFPTARQAAA